MSVQSLSRTDWDEAVAGRRTPMQHYIWMRACYQTLYDEREARIFRTNNGSRIARAAFAERGFPSRLYLIGAEELGEPIDIVYTDENAVAEILGEIMAAGKPLRLGHYPADSPVVSLLKEKANSSGVLFCDPVAGSPFITLDASWATPEAHFNARRRSDLRRMARKAEAIGPVSFDVITPCPEDAPRLVETAIGVEANSWKSRSKTDLSHNDKQAAFFRRYAELASADGILRIAFMRIGETLAAMQIAVECDNAYWVFKIGYDEAFAKCSPGNLLMLEMVRRAAEKGLGSFEFLGKSAAWTKVWTEDERANVRLRYYPRSVSGYAALGLDALGVAGNRIKGRYADWRSGRGAGSPKEHAIAKNKVVSQS